MAWTIAVGIAFMMPKARSTEVGPIRIVVTKSSRLLQVFDGTREVHSAIVTIGAEPEGHKQKRGDKKTPEGAYWLSRKKASSAFYKAMMIDYPNLSDKVQAKAAGVDPGDDILLHGQPLRRLEPTEAEGTEGCVELSNKDMDIVWALTQAGAWMEIRP